MSAQALAAILGRIAEASIATTLEPLEDEALRQALCPSSGSSPTHGAVLPLVAAGLALVGVDHAMRLVTQKFWLPRHVEQAIQNSAARRVLDAMNGIASRLFRP